MAYAIVKNNTAKIVEVHLNEAAAKDGVNFWNRREAYQGGFRVEPVAESVFVDYANGKEIGFLFEVA